MYPQRSGDQAARRAPGAGSGRALAGGSAGSAARSTDRAGAAALPARHGAGSANTTTTPGAALPPGVGPHYDLMTPPPFSPPSLRFPVRRDLGFAHQAPVLLTRL